MNPLVREAMAQGGIADITTTGRRSGLPRRIEIYFHHLDGHYYLTGRPGRRRDWEANIKTNPDFVLHLKGGVTADIPVIAEPSPGPEERAEILRRALIESWGRDPEVVESSLDEWVEEAPFVRFRPLEG